MLNPNNGLKVFLLLIISIGCNLSNDYDTKYLEGVWWSEFDEPSAVFEISKDSIFYVEEMVTRSFMVDENLLRIQENGAEITSYSIVELTTTSMSLKTENGNIIRLHKKE